MSMHAHIEYKRERHDQRRGRMRRMVVLIGCALSLSVYAATEAEDDINKAPMPHESQVERGAMVKVHWVSSHGYLEGKPDNATSLAMMHEQVENCVRSNQKHGFPSKPPRAWPEHVISSRIDTYAAINRTISYSTGLAYGVDPRDCSLIETRISTAKLFSARGECEIDFRAKTAHGACDASGQADAAPPQRQPSPSEAQIEAAERNAAHNPAMAAWAAAVRRYPLASTGERKTIAGLECDVWRNPFDPDGTVCMSRGGSFVASSIPGDSRHSGMALEMTSIAGVKMHATQARLDTMVSNAVFTPYLAGGIHISATGARR